MKYIIYMHKLKKDNRVYIGITCQKPEKRWQRGLGYIRSSYFYNAIKKYGWNSFDHIILFQNLTKKEAENKEIELIKLYKSNVKGYGFNINEGGFAPTMTEEQKIKISNSEKGKKVCEESILKRKKTMRENYLKYGLTEKQKNWYKRKTKLVMYVETGIKYCGQKELNKNGFNGANVYSVCYNKRKSANGYHWQFVEGV